VHPKNFLTAYAPQTLIASFSAASSPCASCGLLIMISALLGIGKQTHPGLDNQPTTQGKERYTKVAFLKKHPTLYTKPDR
jgi:hypothetical protein